MRLPISTKDERQLFHYYNSVDCLMKRLQSHRAETNNVRNVRNRTGTLCTALIRFPCTVLHYLAIPLLQTFRT